MRHGKRVRRRSRRRGWGLLLGALLLILGLVACTRAALRPDTPAPVPAPEHSEAPEHTAPAASAPPPAVQETESPRSTPEATPEPTDSGQAAESAPPAESMPPKESGAEQTGEYDYSQPVPESAQAPEDWFDDAVFIGDSRTDGLILYSGIKGADALSYKGLMVSELEDKTVKFTISGVKGTVMGELAKKDYQKVYIMLGINELGWYNDQGFYDTYAQEVDRVRELQPDAQIYLQSLLPVTAEKSSSHAYFTNENVDRYNALIQQLAEEKQVYYLDVASVFRDENGALPADYSTDGIHLKRDYYKLWLEYLQNHVVEGESR